MRSRRFRRGGVADSIRSGSLFNLWASFRKRRLQILQQGLQGLSKRVEDRAATLEELREREAETPYKIRGSFVDIKSRVQYEPDEETEQPESPAPRQKKSRSRGSK